MSKKRQTQGHFSQTKLEFCNVNTIAAMAHFSKRLVIREQSRFGGDAETAAARVARRLRAAPGTFANIIRKRVKKVSADLRDRIVAAALSDIEREIERLEHEQRILESMGYGPSHDDYRTAEDALETARACLSRMRGQA